MIVNIFFLHNYIAIYTIFIFTFVTSKMKNLTKSIYQQWRNIRQPSSLRKRLSELWIYTNVGGVIRNPRRQRTEKYLTLNLLFFSQGIADIFWRSNEQLKINFAMAKKFHNDAVIKKIATFFLFLLFLLPTVPSFAQCDSGDCQWGKGTYKFANGDVYNGYWQAGRMFGRGTYTFHTGGKYFGDMMDDTMNGKGILYWPAGGVKFQGLFFNGEPIILDTAKKNMCLTGDCVNGQGIYMYEHGTFYLGYFKDHHIDKYGLYYYLAGDGYYGYVYRNNEEGYGVTLFITGDIYIGNWHDAKISGKGKYTFKNGQYYIGNWKEALRSGYGTLYNKDGYMAMTGKWEDGNCTAPAKEIISFDTGFSHRLHKIIAWAKDSFNEVKGIDIIPATDKSTFFSNFSLLTSSEDFIVQGRAGNKNISYQSTVHVDSAFLDKDFKTYQKKIAKCLGKEWKKIKSDNGDSFYNKDEKTEINWDADAKARSITIRFISLIGNPQ